MKSGNLRAYTQLMLFGLALILIFLVLFNTLYKTPYTASVLYFNYASYVINGGIPYRDFGFEYPPFALVFFLLPRLLTPNYGLFATLFEIETLVFSLIGLLLTYQISRLLGKTPWKMLTVYILAILAVGPIIARQYDIFPAIMVLLAVYYFETGRHKTSWAILALGTLTKIFPIVLAPVFLIYYLRNRLYKPIWSGIITFALINLVIAIPFFTIGQDAIAGLFKYHAMRGIQVESTYSAFLLAAEKLGLTRVTLVYNFGSWNLAGPLPDILAHVSPYLTLFVLLAAYWYTYRLIKPGESQFFRIGPLSILVITLVLITSKVLSPQYPIWLVPLFSLILSRWRYPVLVTFILIGGLTYFIFPDQYLALLNLHPLLVFILLIRDCLIILLAVLAATSLNQKRVMEQVTPS